MDLLYSLSKTRARAGDHVKSGCPRHCGAWEKSTAERTSLKRKIDGS